MTTVPNNFDRLSDSIQDNVVYATVVSNNGHLAYYTLSLLANNGNVAKTISQANLYKSNTHASNFANKHNAQVVPIADLWLCTSDDDLGFAVGDLVLIETIMRKVDDKNRLSQAKADLAKQALTQNYEQTLRYSLPYRDLSEDGKNEYMKVIHMAIEANLPLSYCVNELSQYLESEIEIAYNPSLSKHNDLELTSEIDVSEKIEEMRNEGLSQPSLYTSIFPVLSTNGTHTSNRENQANLGQSETVEVENDVIGLTENDALVDTVVTLYLPFTHATKQPVRFYNTDFSDNRIDVHIATSSLVSEIIRLNIASEAKATHCDFYSIVDTLSVKIAVFYDYGDLKFAIIENEIITDSVHFMWQVFDRLAIIKTKNYCPNCGQPLNSDTFGCSTCEYLIRSKEFWDKIVPVELPKTKVTLDHLKVLYANTVTIAKLICNGNVKLRMRMVEEIDETHYLTSFDQPDGKVTRYLTRLDQNLVRVIFVNSWLKQLGVSEFNETVREIVKLLKRNQYKYQLEVIEI
jgi:hypothetical protein